MISPLAHVAAMIAEVLYMEHGLSAHEATEAAHAMVVDGRVLKDFLPEITLDLRRGDFIQCPRRGSGQRNS